MKKLLLVIAVFCLSRVDAQIVNAGFENWANNTSYFAGFTGVVPGDTFTYSDPVQWTSANGVTGDTALGGRLLATQSATSHNGTSSIQLTTDTLTTIYISALNAYRQLCVPGLILNGVFPVSNITQNIVSLSNSSISPGAVAGAGQPFVQRLADFTGYYQYTPVYNQYTHANDTCVIWATLRKGSTVVANAEYKSGAATVGWGHFSVPFTYLSCETPDTLVILLSSSLPNFTSVLSGNTNLSPGSVLLVDDLAYDTLPASQSIVVAVVDRDTMFKNKVDTINVLNNDASCSSLNLTVSLNGTPAHGTATLLGNEIVYTPNSNYVGPDTIYYTDTDPNNVTSSAYVIINVTINTGISEANEIAVKMFPVPANNELHIQFENKGRTAARIYDIVGNVVNEVALTQNDNNINVSGLANGVYGIQLLNESNAIIARGKFVVSK